MMISEGMNEFFVLKTVWYSCDEYPQCKSIRPPTIRNKFMAGASRAEAVSEI